MAPGGGEPSAGAFPRKTKEKKGRQKMNCGGCEENCTGDVRCHQCGEPMCPDVRGPGPGGEHFCSRECEEEWRAEMREQEPDEEGEPLPAASCGGTTQQEQEQPRRKESNEKIESDANVSLPRRVRPAGDSVSAPETPAAIVRENTIYAGRNGEMTLDECITRCDNNSGDDPRGRDVAQIGGWLRELRERRRAPGNAPAPQGPASAAPAAEPLAAILAEMREAAKSTDLFNGEEVGEPLIRGSKVEDWADRIEAAAERERERAEADALTVGGMVEASRHKPGSAAAMREAMDILEKLDYAIPYVYQNRSPQNEIARLVRIAGNKVREALAAPARNCDRFKNVGDALKAHCAYCERRQTPQPHCLGGRDMMCSACLDCFADWLFDPIKENGGNKQ